MSFIMRFLLLSLLAVPLISFSQNSVRELPPNINRPSLNLFAPYVSGDGETMIYLSDYADDGNHTMYWTTRKGVSQWNDGKEINSLVNRPTLNFRGGYSLSFDGDVLFFTSRKSGMGGFDLWYSELKNGDWTAPRNFGKPVNSASNEGSPSLSADGGSLYFMRCEAMAEYRGAGGCRLMVTHKTYNGWEEPVPLPGNINTGNSQTPRILADGETLIFSSDMAGGKGGLDLYLTRKTGEDWSDPVPLTFLNTEYNDVFISVPSKGRYAYASVKLGKNFQLVEQLIPESLRPARVMRLKGKVMDRKTGAALPSELTVFNVTGHNRTLKISTGKSGEFALVLKEGSDYDFSIMPQQAGYTYFSKSYPLQTIDGRDKEIMRIILNPVSSAEEISRDISFKPNTSSLDEFSDFEIRRLTTLLQDNPDLELDITVRLNAYREDSLQSDPDLTEIRTDTLWTPPADSLVDDPSDAQYVMEYRDMDSVYFVAPDSTRRAYPADYVSIVQTFHNDRTEAQTTTLREALLEKGVREDRLHFTKGIIPAAVEEMPDSLLGEKIPENTPAGDEEPPLPEVEVIIKPFVSKKG